MEKVGWGRGLEKLTAKRGYMWRGKKVGCSSSSPVHDHPDQFCKKETRKRQVWDSWSRSWQRPPPTTACGAKATSSSSFGESGWEMLHLEADPPYSAHPEERRVKEGTERKRWGNHLYLLFSQSIWPCLWSKKSWLEKPSSLYAFL